MSVRILTSAFIAFEQLVAPHDGEDVSVEAYRNGKNKVGKLSLAHQLQWCVRIWKTNSDHINPH